jgi:hypothetical protein
MQQELIGAKHILRAASLSYRQLDLWCRAGLLKPASKGSGVPRRFDAADLYVVVALARLAEIGCPLAGMQVASFGLYDVFSREGNPHFLVMCGETVKVIQGHRGYESYAATFTDLPAPTSPAWITPLDVVS